MALACPASASRALSSPFLATRLALRTYATTRPGRSFANPNLGKQAESQPAYPHGAERFYKSANRGLYGNVRLRTGNNVSGKNEIKTRRRWYPNVHNKRLWSETLGRFVRVRVVIRVLRTIDKAGGLDRYLLGQTPGRLRELGPTGWALRWRVLRTPKGAEMWEEERRRLGLEGPGPRSEGWASPLAAAMAEAHGLPAPGVEGRAEPLVEEPEEVLEARERAIDEEIEAQDREEGGIDLTEETVQPGRKTRLFGNMFNKG